MKKITFIHAADLHLDSPMIGLKHLPDNIFQRLRESTFRALKKIIDTALKKEVDFVIFAGDLYDDENRSLRAQVRFRKEMDRLAERNIPVFIVHGNHDHLGGTWPHLQMPENVHIFAEDVEVKIFQKNATTVHLYGFSYTKRHVLERKIGQYEKAEGADFHIGILHGNMEGSSEHGNYAPFHLKELLEKQFDYWALGHIHKQSVLSESPPVVYPGSIQGLNKKEKGIKGCYLVSMTDHSPSLQFIETADVIWQTAEVDGSSIQNFHEIFEVCRKAVEDQRREGFGILLYLSLKNMVINQLSSVAEEILDTLQAEEKQEESFVWPVSLSLEEQMNWKRSHLTLEADFYGELFLAIDEYNGLEASLSSLYQHPAARKYVGALTDQEKQILLKAAEDLLIRQLYKG